MNRQTFLALALIGVLLLAGCGGAPATPTVRPVPAATAEPTGAVPTSIAAPLATPTRASAISPLATPGAAISPLSSPLPSPASGLPGRTLTVMTHSSFSASEEVVGKFQAQCNCQVKFLQAGDAGLVLNQAILSKGNPLADVLYGVDNSFLSRALAAGIFEPYASPALAQIPADLKLDASNQLLPVDYGYVNLNYDKAYFAQRNLAVPQSLRDLTKPEYKGLLVVENAATSSPGLAFLLTTVTVFGETGEYNYLNFWRDLRANDVLVVDGWETAYNERFSAGSGKGERPLVVSYATSPAAEVFYSDPQPTEAPTGNILPAGQSYRQIEFVGVLRGARNADLARQWVDFMLGEIFQPDIPLQMWVYPARTGTALPEVFAKFAQVPAEPAALAPERIEAGREKWLQAWTEAVLR